MKRIDAIIQSYALPDVLKALQPGMPAPDIGQRQDSAAQ